MSKIANDGLTRLARDALLAVPICQQWASKGLTENIRHVAISLAYRT